jgi:hypothetical protein
MSDKNADLTGMYLVCTSKSHYYVSGSGQFATPKLYYSKGTAAAVARRFNKTRKHPSSDGKYVIVPVTLVLGKPEDPCSK